MHWLREEAGRGVLWIGQDTPGYRVASCAQQHSLVLLEVGRKHQGTYTCIATNNAGQALCSASLQVSSGEWRGHWGTRDPSLGAPWPAPTLTLGPSEAPCHPEPLLP